MSDRADKGDHPGIHIDPTDFYKDIKKEEKYTENINKQGDIIKNKENDKDKKKDLVSDSSKFTQEKLN